MFLHVFAVSFACACSYFLLASTGENSECIPGTRPEPLNHDPSTVEERYAIPSLYYKMGCLPAMRTNAIAACWYTSKHLRRIHPHRTALDRWIWDLESSCQGPWYQYRFFFVSDGLDSHKLLTNRNCTRKSTTRRVELKIDWSYDPLVSASLAKTCFA